jgi:hypothetical protein
MIVWAAVKMPILVLMLVLMTALILALVPLLELEAQDGRTAGLSASERKEDTSCSAKRLSRPLSLLLLQFLLLPLYPGQAIATMMQPVGLLL